MERNEERVDNPARNAPNAGGAGGGAASTEGSGGSSRSAGEEGRYRARQHADPINEGRERAAELKSTLADKLEAGAEKLRYRTRDGAERVAAVSADIGAAATQRLGHYSDTVASGMERTAGWLRRGDLSDVGDAIVQQVQEHPARTLLVTLGVGYLIGRMLKD
jgi:hypothetical protein